MIVICKDNKSFHLQLEIGEKYFVEEIFFHSDQDWFKLQGISGIFINSRFNQIDLLRQQKIEKIGL